MIDKAIAAHPDNKRFSDFHSFGLAFLGLFEEADAEGNDQVKFMIAMAKEDFGEAERLLDENLAGEDAKEFYENGTWLYKVFQGEGSRERLAKLTNLRIAKFEEDQAPWQESCILYLVLDLRILGRESQTESMMKKCRDEMEERFKAKYLCPCTWERVVLFTIMDGRIDEAVARADQWLTNGGSDLTLHVDPIFNLLADHSEYPGLMARNAAQVQRQRDIYLAATSNESGSASLPN
jgi:hypothetical protein